MDGVRYAERVWLKVRGERGKSPLYIHGCVYMPMDSAGTAALNNSYSKLKKDVFGFKQRELLYSW